MIEHPECSFMPHMPIIKLNRETTKCRNVFLSNLCENKPSKVKTISHNQAMFSGPNINQKITTALLNLRFGENLLCFNLQRAFHQLALNEIDSNRLLFLWFRNVRKGDFSLV